MIRGYVIRWKEDDRLHEHDTYLGYIDEGRGSKRPLWTGERRHARRFSTWREADTYVQQCWPRRGEGPVIFRIKCALSKERRTQRT